MANKYPRWQIEKLKIALTKRRVILLEGARQCGKTTLAKMISNNLGIYYTLDDETLLNAAKEDPSGFVTHGDDLMIIDEIQRAPNLLTAVKKNVDENIAPGRFVLTGSANIQSLPNVTESLAGRVRKIRLRPLAIGEINFKTPLFLDKIFNAKFSEVPSSNLTKDDYLNLALKGGYPEALAFDAAEDRQEWHKDYIDAILERDLKEIANVRRRDNIYKLLQAAAAWSSKPMDISAIGSNLSLSRLTLETYLNAIETMYIIERLRPWIKTDYERVAKKDKLFFSDTGLMSSTLDWTLDKVRLNGELNGKLIETFVHNQLSALIECQSESFHLSYYRDREKREVDFILENSSDTIIGLEIKSGTNINKDDFKHLEWFRENMAKSQNKKFQSIILYSGKIPVSFGNNLWALPISSLWEA